MQIKILLSSCVLALAAALPQGALAAYLIRPGDALEVSVAGIPDFRQKVVVDQDGLATIPMIQPVAVAGLDLASAQKLIKGLLSQKLYQQRGADGRENVIAITPDSVSLSIAEYRPVYVSGDVTKPGELPFRPGMSVRNLVALAGGYEIMRFRMNNPFLEAADLRNDYQTQWMRYVELQAKIWRLTAQLASSDKPPEPGSLEKATEAPLPKDMLESMRANARQQLQVETSRFSAEKIYLASAVNVTEGQIKLLRDRQVKDNENVQGDIDDYNKLKEFSRQGNVPMNRLSESRRLFLFSSTQSLQTGVQLTNTVRERDEAQRKIARLAESNRADILKELQEANVALGAVRSQIQAVSEKITYTGMIRSQLSRGAGKAPAITIYRAAIDGGGVETASEDTPLKPGDTVEVALHTEAPGVTE